MSGAEVVGKGRTRSSFRSGHRLAPRRLERFPGILDGRIHVLGRGMGEIELLDAGGRVDGGECLVIRGGLPLVVAAQRSARGRNKKTKNVHEQTGRDRGFPPRGEFDSLVYVGHSG